MATQDRWLIDQWKTIDPSLSDGAALFAIAQPLRKPTPPHSPPRKKTLQHLAQLLRHDMDLDQLLAAQKEYSVALNSELGPSRIRSDRYQGLDVPAVVQAMNRNGLEVCAFGSTPATWDARLIVPTDDVDFFGDLDQQWDAVVATANDLGAQLTWEYADPSVEANGIAKVTLRGWFGIVELYHHPTLLRAYGQRRNAGVSYGDALEDRNEVEIDGVRVETLTIKAAMICTACVNRGGKDSPKAAYFEACLNPPTTLEQCPN